MGETVQYKTPNGGNVSGYLATATGARNMSWSSRSGGDSTLRSAGCAIALRRQALTPLAPGSVSRTGDDGAGRSQPPHRMDLTG